MLYGRDVRGPLDVLKEEWIKKPDMEMDILSYMTRVRDCMETAKEIVQENLEIAQGKQKFYYDKRAREIQFTPGEKVLLLLPSSTHKFQAHWQGLYTITKKTSTCQTKVIVNKYFTSIT